MTDLVDRLERALRADPADPLPADRLRAIRAQGRRRRTRHRALAAAGAGVAVLVLGGVPATVLVGPEDAGPTPAAPSPVEDPTAATEPAEPTEPPIAASPDLPEDLAALQQRILAEVPGAVRSSPTQVDVPDPRVADPDLQPPASGYDRVDGAFGIGVDHYQPPSSFPPDAFPSWLVRGWDAFYQGAIDAGLTGLASAGVRVAAGEWRMGCDPYQAARGCRPILLTRSGLTASLDRPSGPGQVAVTRPDPYARGGAPSLAVAIVRQDDVTSARFVTGDGESVTGRVDTQLAPGRSIVWAAVPGEVRSVVVDGEER